MEGTYGKGKYCPSGPDSCKDLEQLSNMLADSRDPKELRDIWIGWHAIGKPIRVLPATPERIWRTLMNP